MSTLNCLDSISLIRYLIVWRVNSSLVWLPRCLSTEMSPILGQIITKRLPTNEARAWRKTLDQPGKSTEPSWPIEAVLFTRPGKRTYGSGETILWELKLFGGEADHGFFLEVILPAMEEAGYISDPKWNRPNRLWGRFDIHSVYVARGLDWEPLVTSGQLDLRCRVSPVQWAEGLSFAAETKFSKPTRLTWVTSFDLAGGNTRRKKKANAAPTLDSILRALISRMEQLGLSPGEDQPIQDAMEQAGRVSMIHRGIRSAPKGSPARWAGSQLFPYIPSPVIPYLELASILHIGRRTHLGCGTYSLIQSKKEAF